MYVLQSRIMAYSLMLTYLHAEKAMQKQLGKPRKRARARRVNSLFRRTDRILPIGEPEIRHTVAGVHRAISLGLRKAQVNFLKSKTIQGRMFLSKNKRHIKDTGDINIHLFALAKHIEPNLLDSSHHVHLRCHSAISRC